MQEGRRGRRGHPRAGGPARFMGGQAAGGLTPVRHAQAPQDDAYAMVDRVGGDLEFAGDLLGAHACQHEPQNLAVTLRQ